MQERQRQGFWSGTGGLRWPGHERAGSANPKSTSRGTVHGARVLAREVPRRAFPPWACLGDIKRRTRAAWRG
eukprot:295134-Alexandrium_andersonii.AAC.1